MCACGLARSHDQRPTECSIHASGGLIYDARVPCTKNRNKIYPNPPSSIMKNGSKLYIRKNTPLNIFKGTCLAFKKLQK